MRPKRIILVRHGESEGNADRDAYKRKPSYAYMLTTKGVEQARDAGVKIKSIIGTEAVAVYYSPFFRARQTMENALSQLDHNTVLIKREEPRIREQERALYIHPNKQRADSRSLDEIEEERDRFGHFYYRFHTGESCADVYDRMSDFLGSLFRDFEKVHYPDNAIIFGHGMGNRLFLMRFFHTTVEEFELWANPKNGELHVLERQLDGRYKLMSEMRLHSIGHKNLYIAPE